MTHIVAVVIIFVYLMNTLLKIKKIWEIHNVLKVRQKLDDNKNANIKSFFVLIPVYKEEKNIASTVKYFKKMSNINVHYITTEKEGDIKHNPTYKCIVKQGAKKHIIHYPKKEGDKGHQLNYAIHQISQGIKKEHLSQTYFAIFDADSRPEKEGFTYIAKDENHENIYQMLSIYNVGYNHLGNYNKANARFQTTRSLYFEYFRLSQNYKEKKIVNLMYLIGHGLFLRGDIAKKFPIPEYSLTEDIAYGYKLLMNDIYAKVVPYFDYCTVPNKIEHNILQVSRWFQGELLLYREIFMYGYSFGNMKLLLKRYYELFQRAFGPLILIGAVIWIMNHGVYRPFGLLLIALAIDIYLTDYFISQYFFSKHRSKSSPYQDIAFFLLRMALDGIGPIIGIRKNISSRVFNKKTTFYRTPR